MTTAYVPAYLDPRFRQSLPKPPDALTLVTPEPTQWAPQLLYRDPDSGEEYLVPNVTYNQPKANRVRAAEWYVEQAKERLAACEAFLQAHPGTAARYNVLDAQQLLQRAEEALAEAKAR